MKKINSVIGQTSRAAATFGVFNNKNDDISLFLYLPRYKRFLLRYTALATLIILLVDICSHNQLNHLCYFLSPEYGGQINHIFLVVFAMVIFTIVALISVIKPLGKMAGSDYETINNFHAKCEHTQIRHQKLFHYLNSQEELGIITRAHLENVVSQTDSAAHEIITQAQEIDQSITNLVDILLSLRNESDTLASQSHSTIADNKESITRLHSYIENRKKDLENDYKSTQSLTENAKSMSSLVELIKDISDQTNLLALNASIEAARAGNEGRSFAVVAGKVRELSTRSEQAASQIGKAIADMSNHIEIHFGDKLNKQTHAEENKLLINLKLQLSGLEEGYKRVDGLNNQIFERVGTSADTVSLKITQLLSNIQFQDITRQQIELVVRAISATNEYINLLKPCIHRPERCVPACSVPNFNLENVCKYYVMKKQRDIHYQVTNKNSPQPSDKINNASGSAENEITFF